ncbi:hypothetical protein FNJ62_08390 [Streptomyces benahoarensis]|uniref:Uncharacterized protein n=1 Tax=Streptomyces benahoarensis TaxID=2595054 RepID=A0A553ZNH7_9ACTN|nr:hypothetical protein FNJ62_08390 [Streptomyces benahoarensis]TSB42955.1 hypothetical protein FNZ23_07175 [Streptomyces benahoarensis]
MRARWRNPLRRRTDRIESLLTVLTVLLIGLGAPVAGAKAGGAVHDALLATVRAQAAHRHLVWATVDRLATRAPMDPDPETSSRHDSHLRVIARWTAWDGSPRMGRIGAPRPVEPGDRFRIWTDDRGLVIPRPMDESTAATHATLAGLGVAACAGGLVEGARRLAVRQQMVRRYRRWDEAWARAGQTWGRADAGN